MEEANQGILGEEAKLKFLKGYFRDNPDEIKSLIANKRYLEMSDVINGVVDNTAKGWEDSGLNHNYRSAVDVAYHIFEIVDNIIVNDISDEYTRTIFANTAAHLMDSETAKIKDSDGFTLGGKMRASLNNLDFGIKDSGEVFDKRSQST